MTNYENARGIISTGSDSAATIRELRGNCDELAAQLAAANARAEAAEARAVEWENAFNDQCAARVNEGAALFTQMADLRAQLAAAEAEWRPVSEPPNEGGGEYEIVVRGYWHPRYDNRGGAFVARNGAGLTSVATKWRPAPDGGEQ